VVNTNLEQRIIDFETVNPCWNLRESPIDTELLLGCDPELQPIRVKFQDLPHWFILGQSGSGKSVLLRCQIADLMMNYSPKAVQFVLSDLKGETFYRIPDNSPWLAQPISINDPETSLCQIQWLIEESERRQRLFQGVGVSNWENYVELMQQHNQPIIPRLIYFSDENSDLSEKGGKWTNKWESLMLELVRKCRSRGINVIITQQRGTADQISRAIASNLQGRICLKVVDKYNSITCIEQPGGEFLLGKGDLLAKTRTELLKLRSPYITPSCWSQIVNTAN
jgi:S-DNA-T family DNA segregation ATPase FtsK/SpoIIIE